MSRYGWKVSLGLFLLRRVCSTWVNVLEIRLLVFDWEWIRLRAVARVLVM